MMRLVVTLCSALAVVACNSPREVPPASLPLESVAPRVAEWSQRASEADWNRDSRTLLADLVVLSKAAPPAEAELLTRLEGKLRPVLLGTFPEGGHPQVLMAEAGSLLQRYREVSGAQATDARQLSLAILHLAGRLEVHSVIESERAWIEQQLALAPADARLTRALAVAQLYGGDSTRATLTTLARCLQLDRHDDTCQHMFVVHSGDFREPTCERVRASDRFAVFEVKADAPREVGAVTLEHLVTPALLTGSDVRVVTPHAPGAGLTGHGQAHLQLSDKGSDRFLAATTRLAPEGRVAVVVDGTVTSVPVVLDPIRGSLMVNAPPETLAALCEEVGTATLPEDLGKLRKQVIEDLRARGVDVPD